jgi:hypothetical protein
MRVTFFDFRQAVADPTYRPSTNRSPFPNPGTVLRAAVKTYHEEGYEAAQRRLDKGFGGYFSREGSPAGMARVARANFDVYVKLDGLDGRPVFDTGVRRVLNFGADELVVTLDVLLLDPDGYVGRIVLWGEVPPMSHAQLELFATPAILAMRQSLGRDRVVAIEIWEIRTETVTRIGNERADAREMEVRGMLQRFSAAEGEGGPQGREGTLW